MSKCSKNVKSAYFEDKNCVITKINEREKAEKKMQKNVLGRRSCKAVRVHETQQSGFLVSCFPKTENVEEGTGGKMK